MSRDDPPADVWVTDGTYIDTSSIAGNGLWTRRPIAAGAAVVRFGGRLVTSLELARIFSDADADPDAPYVDSISIDEGLNLVLPAGSPAHFVNHHCNPNLWYGDPYQLVARYNIAAGEELTVDYSTLSAADDGYSIACGCKSPDCRGVVSNDDWQRPELRQRYGGRWVPALRRRVTIC